VASNLIRPILQVFSWGNNDSGQLGRSAPIHHSPDPSAFSEAADGEAVSEELQVSSNDLTPGIINALDTRTSSCVPSVTQLFSQSLCQFTFSSPATSPAATRIVQL
jgi:hypothetical protein